MHHRSVEITCADRRRFHAPGFTCDPLPEHLPRHGLPGLEGIESPVIGFLSSNRRHAFVAGLHACDKSHMHTGLCELVHTRKQNMPTWYQCEHSQSLVAANAEAQLPQPTGQHEGLCAWSSLQTSICSNYLIPQSLGHPSRPRSSQYSLNKQSVYWSFIRVYRGSGTRYAQIILLDCVETVGSDQKFTNRRFTSIFFV